MYIKICFLTFRDTLQFVRDNNKLNNTLNKSIKDIPSEFRDNNNWL